LRLEETFFGGGTDPSIGGKIGLDFNVRACFKWKKFENHHFSIVEVITLSTIEEIRIVTKAQAFGD